MYDVIFQTKFHLDLGIVSGLRGSENLKFVTFVRLEISGERSYPYFSPFRVKFGTRQLIGA